MVQRIDISQGWEFRQSSSLNDGTASSYLPVAQFPTVAHIDLLHHELIPDPYIDINELECLWVNDADWTYRTEKIEPVTLKESERAVLVFEGLDTVVDVHLNDKHILFSNNMHITNRVDVTDHLRGREELSVLELRFRAAPAYARSEMDRIGYKRLPTGRAVNFGGPERLFVRKAQYHWGWDWGPAINTSGPWKPIYLEVYESRISQFLVSQNVADDLSSVDITVKGKVENPNGIGKVSIQLVDNSNEDEVVAAFVELASDGSFECHLKVDDPKLWYPFMYGEQHLYTIKASTPGHTVNKTVGMRRLRLLQEPLKDQPGSSFIFEVNNIRLFCGGSCWIPADFMLPRTDQRTRENWFRLMKEGNQTMVRVWGGGIVEDDMFYDLADRQGILVWQDFLFACGNYPASPDFVANVKNEAEQQVERVGHHASLVLWCGNNEDYMCADQDRCWDVDYSDTTGPWDKTTFPAREIYERTLPGVIAASGTDVPYWISSPYGGKESNDTTVGDTHCWDVWHGKLSPYQDYKIYKSRFISEFGFESAPSLKTLERAITDPKERHSQSRTFDAHDKGPGHARRCPMYMGENYRFRMNPLKDFVYCSQFLQAEALGYAYNLWRREFRGPGQEYCAGALVWQMNDIWPGSSWALVDVSNRPKPAYYVTRRALAKTVLGMERVVTEKPPYITTGYPDEKSRLDVWAVNGELEDRRVILELKAFDIQSGKQIELAGDYQKEWVLKANQTTELVANIDIPNHRETVVAGYLTDPTGKNFLERRLARWISWPEPLKYMRPCPDLKITSRNWGHNSRVILSTNAPVKGVVVNGKYRGAAANNYTGGYDATFYDNFIDLVPGEEVYVKVRGVLWGEEAVTVRFLYDWELESGFEL